MSEPQDNSPLALLTRWLRLDGDSGKSSSHSLRSTPNIKFSSETTSNSGTDSPKVSSTRTSDYEPSKYRLAQFEQALEPETLDLKLIHKISWSGIPNHYRPEIWQMLLGYLPVNKGRRAKVISRKRTEYIDTIPLYFNMSEADRTTSEGEILRQILVDLPRTNPTVPFFQQKPIQDAMMRILYIWSIRHPASGYVQGMDDLLSPIILICTQQFIPEPLRCDAGSLSTTILNNVEADAFWCMTKLLDNIQDHYTFSQPGIQRMVLRLEDLVNRLDKELHNHFVNEGVMYFQFSFRWMNCALIRELPLKCIIRLWDTYFSEGASGFENFHVYVCAVILIMFKADLMKLDFQGILMFLQDLPTANWTEEDVEPVLSQAYILSSLFDDSPNHLG